MKQGKNFILLAISFFLGSCNLFVEHIGYNEIGNWVLEESNGYVKNVNIGETTYQCIYLPYQLYAVQELLKQEDLVSKALFDSTVNDYQKSIVFRLKVKIKDGTVNLFDYQCSDYQSKSSRQYYLQNLLKNDFTLNVGNVEIQCLEALCENNFNVSPWTDITLLFENTNKEIKKEDLVLRYKDQLLGTSINLFRFPSSQRKSLPTIVF
jgi:hypothetical protein